MATPSPTTLRTLYRNLLRELPPRPVLASPRAPLHQRLRERFEQPTSSSTSSSSSSPRISTPDAAAQAEQYLAYLRAQRTYVTLLERYNPGMGMEQDERVRLTARKVGMDLPKLYEGEEGGEKKTKEEENGEGR
ncbi:hypothetical protein VTJ83DRAFT_7132 [Remersonia thermophila]|uniref:Uncharacterized protein n=1 Tax=Remersonia thermophila TaxID=72144 RepID=A0ABR4D2N3_9PEZI